MSTNSIKQYAHAILLFCKYMRVENPDQALKTTSQDLFGHTDKFVDFLLKDRQQASKTVRLMFHGLKFWLECNGLNVDVLKKVSLPKSSEVKTEDRKPTMQELCTVLPFANIRDIALIQIAASSGLRVNTIADLKLKDVNWNPYEDVRSKDEEVKVKESEAPAMITVNPAMGRKSAKKYFTFLTPQAKQSLKRYVEWRKRQGEKVTENSYMMASVYGEGHSENSGRAASFGEPVTGDTLAKSWDRLLDKAGLSKKSHKWRELHFHTLRKFLKSECVNAGCKSQYVEFWLGHRGAYLDDSYFRADLKEHLAEYAKAMPNLAVTMEMNVLTQNVEMLRKNGENKSMEIEKLKADLEEMKGYFYKVGFKVGQNSQKVRERVERGEYDDVEQSGQQKVVEEKELQAYLEKGWKCVSVLPSGKIVITNE